MTNQEIETKIKELDVWLVTNPNHFDYVNILKQKRDLEQRIKEQDYE